MKNQTISDTDLRSIISIKKKTRSGQYICDCPFCGKESHFYINYVTQLFDCKKCGASGSIYKLLRHLDKLYLLGDKTVENTEEIDSIRSLLSKQEVNPSEVKELSEVKMPVGFKVGITPYLRSRGLTVEDCEKYSIGKTDIVFKYNGYVLFPIYDDGKVRGFLGRYGNKQVPEGKLRYKNSLNTDFASLLYGYDDIVKGETETVIITEGVFDKIAVDKKLGLFYDNSIRCVCTFGKKISQVQISKLMQKEISNVILSWDYDALKEIKGYGIELERYFNVSVAVSCNKKDIDECSLDETFDVFMNARPITEFNNGVIAKLKR